MNKKKKTNRKALYIALAVLVLLLVFYLLPEGDEPLQAETPAQTLLQTLAPEAQEEPVIPHYSGKMSARVNGNVPMFTEADIERGKKGAFEDYGKLDSLGRCTAAFACLSQETMPDKGEKRESISSIHPTGWRQARYDCVDSETVLSRAHLIGWMLGAENANEKNLITGTRYMNSDAMLEFELEAADYLDENPDRHVLYRVTPVFEGENLMADGVLMEAMSLEDGGKSVNYCVFIYNVQPGVEFDYATGESVYNGMFFDTDADSVITDDIELGSYVLDIGTNTIHRFSCPKLSDIKSGELLKFAGDRNMEKEWSTLGYKLCDCMK